MSTAVLIRKSALHTADPIVALREEYLRTGKPSSHIVTITPAIARSLLEGGNADNRSVNQRSVEIIAGDIRRGNWVVNGEPIILSTDGEVNDGQHRLWAVIESGVDIQTAVTYGFPRDTRLTVDLGRARTTSDFLSMSGVQNSTLASAVAAKLLRYRNGNLGAKAKDALDSKPAINAYFFEHRTEIEQAISRVQANQKLFRLVCNESVIVFTVVVMARHAGIGTAMNFWEPVATGVNLDVGSPQLVLRNRCMRDRSMPVAQRVELIFRAWNVWRGGRTVATLPIIGNIPELK